VESDEANLELILIDGSVYAHKGKPDFVDREVDTTTGAMLVQASFPNPERLLRPGPVRPGEGQGVSSRTAS
jgi:membrane fusion protein (multidrug efflux system)